MERAEALFDYNPALLLLVIASPYIILIPLAHATVYWWIPQTWEDWLLGA